ncbi:hypothetical protein B0H10DRAFT_2229665 [Mycena sp. CBHHK59/15]|nr:hypothetical protein B0H10DRAFT_2229665 [Mycena sp. CBHHK59/15]
MFVNLLLFTLHISCLSFTLTIVFIHLFRRLFIPGTPPNRVGVCSWMKEFNLKIGKEPGVWESKQRPMITLRAKYRPLLPTASASLAAVHQADDTKAISQVDIILNSLGSTLTGRAIVSLFTPERKGFVTEPVETVLSSPGATTPERVRTYAIAIACYYSSSRNADLPALRPTILAIYARPGNTWIPRESSCRHAAIRVASRAPFRHHPDSDSPCPASVLLLSTFTTPPCPRHDLYPPIAIFTIFAIPLDLGDAAAICDPSHGVACVPASAFPSSYPDEAVARLREHGHRAHRDSPRLGPQSWSYSCPSTSTGRCTSRDSGDLAAILGITPNPPRVLREHGPPLAAAHAATLAGTGTGAMYAFPATRALLDCRVVSCSSPPALLANLPPPGPAVRSPRSSAHVAYALRYWGAPCEAAHAFPATGTRTRPRPWWALCAKPHEDDALPPSALVFPPSPPRSHPS